MRRTAYRAHKHSKAEGERDGIPDVGTGPVAFAGLRGTAASTATTASASVASLAAFGTVAPAR
jgi:hypothetical protein